MAPTRLLLEGPAIEPLLRRARAEHGPGVRIVKAERVRVGGLVGFFAREQFEVTVEVDDDGGAVAPPAPAPWVRHDAPGQAGQTGPLPAVLSAAGPQGLDALLAAAEDAEREPAAFGQRSDFDNIFTSVLTTREPGAAAQPAQPPRRVGQVLAAAEVVQPARVLTAATASPTAPVPGLASVTGQQVVAATQATAVALAEAPTAQPVVQPTTRPTTSALTGDGRQFALPDTPLVQRPAPGPVLPGPVLPGGPAGGHPPRDLAVPPFTGPAHSGPSLTVPSGATAHGSAHGSVHSQAHVHSHGRHAHHDVSRVPLPERLAALGVPSEWLWDLPAGRSAALRSIAGRIADAQARLPRRPITSPAPVVAVLAELSAAVPVARHLATGLGLDAAEVAVLQRRGHGASHQRLLAGGREVLYEARARRLEGRPLVVALPAPIGTDPASRAVVADLLGQLEPDDVWAVVDATRRLPDTSAWLASLDGHSFDGRSLDGQSLTGHRSVDALALVNVGATSAPAAALALTVPVVLLGERPASPRAWVEMLAARLSDGAPQ